MWSYKGSLLVPPTHSQNYINQVFTMKARHLKISFGKADFHHFKIHLEKPKNFKKKFHPHIASKSFKNDFG